MCQHEGRACPGRSCRCECMNCMFPDEHTAIVWCQNAEHPEGFHSETPECLDPRMALADQRGDDA